MDLSNGIYENARISTNIWRLISTLATDCSLIPTKTPLILLINRVMVFKRLNDIRIHQPLICILSIFEDNKIGVFI